MQERFAQLLNAFFAIAAKTAISEAPRAAQFRILLQEFAVHRDRAAAAGQAQAAEDRVRIKALLDGYRDSWERYRQQQEHVADDFNLLGVMGLTYKETRHSMVLAWLLDHDLRNFGTHGQGSLGFRLFLSEFRELGLPIDFADCSYRVQPEVVGDESIVDVEVACRGKFIIHIENKIWSAEGTNQTVREGLDLQRRAAVLNVSAPHIHGFFLTPHATMPMNPKFRAISWRRMVRVFKKFAHQAKPPDVKLFADHYARVLKRFIVVQNISEDDNAETTHERS